MKVTRSCLVFVAVMACALCFVVGANVWAQGVFQINASKRNFGQLPGKPGDFSEHQDTRNHAEEGTGNDQRGSSIFSQRAAFYEDFNDGIASGWIDDGSGRWQVSDGAYKMDSYGEIGVAAQSYYAATYADFNLEARIAKTWGDSGWYNGLMFKLRFSPYGRYLFVVSPNGQYCLWKNFSDGSGVNLISWTYSSYINSGLGFWNVLRVVGTGPWMDLYINGYFVTSYYDEFYIPSGYAGFLSHDEQGREISWYDYASLEGDQVWSKLSVLRDPSAGGKVVGYGIDCGADCEETYDRNTLLSLTAVPNPGWKFLYWDDGSLCYAENLLTVTLDTDKTITAKFAPASDDISLTAVDQTPLGGRTPLILIHGNNSEKEKDFRWGNFLKKFRKDSEFSGKYKVYTFRWDSTKSNLDNGIALGYAIDSSIELANEKITFLAHSRGGLVARYFMNRYTIKSGRYAGKLGGERVKYLVTLATPHRGSPGADPIWVKFSLDYNFSSPLAKVLSVIYFSDVWFKKSIWDQHTHPYLVWDDARDELSNDTICWDSSLFGDEFCSPFMVNPDLLFLNEEDRYLRKIITYGGNNFEKGWTVAEITDDPLFLVSEHRKLDLASLLLAYMPIVPTGYPTKVIREKYRPFQANDGMVPLASALFLKPKSGGLFKAKIDGGISYDRDALAKLVMARETIIISEKVDHLEFLDNSRVVKSVISKLKSLR